MRTGTGRSPAADRVDRRRKRAGIFAAALLTGLAGAGAANALETLGNAVAVIPNAIGELGGQQVTIIRGSDLFEGQTITTGDTGEVQIVFVDDTRMVIGPNSALQIERYLLRDPNSFSQLTVNALGGTFRFISGDSPSEAYTMRTPGGTIGVRGTAFDATIPWGEAIVDVMVLHGMVFLCPELADICTTLAERCSVGTITGVLHADVIRNEHSRAELAQAKFPYAENPPGLLRQFRIGNSDECLTELAEFVEPGAAPPPPPPPPPPPEPVECERDNRGLGNGEECVDGEEEEHGNPGQNGGPNGNAYGHEIAFPEEDGSGDVPPAG